MDKAAEHQKMRVEHIDRVCGFIQDTIDPILIPRSVQSSVLILQAKAVGINKVIDMFEGELIKGLRKEEAGVLERGGFKDLRTALRFIEIMRRRGVEIEYDAASHVFTFKGI